LKKSSEREGETVAHVDGLIAHTSARRPLQGDDAAISAAML